MKQGWKKKTFREILEKTETINPIHYPEKEFEYIDVSSVSNITFTIEKTQKIKGKNAPSRARRLVRINDVIFATVRPTLKRIAVVPDQLDNQICSTGYFVLRPRSEVNYRFLFYSLFCDDFQKNMEKLQKGASYPAVTDNDVRNQVLSFPPLPEQQRIVDILDQSFAAIDQAIENTISNANNSKEIFESFLNQIFTSLFVNNPIKKINEVNTIRPPKNEAKDQLAGNSLVSFAPMEDLGINQIFLIPNKTRKLNEVYSGYTYFSDNDVLLAKITPCFENGKIGIAKNLKNSIGFGSSEYIIIRRPKHLRQKFLYYYLSRETFRNEGIKYMQGAVGHKRVPLDFLANYKIPIPPISKQDEILNKIDNFFDNTNLLKSNYDNKKELLQELKQSILHKAFQGELS